MARPRSGGIPADAYRPAARRSRRTAIEYGLIAALISIACILAFQALGLNLADVFNTVADAMAGRA